MTTNSVMVNQLRDRRERADLTQQELADRAGVSRSMLRLLEQGYEPRRGSDVRTRILRVLDELDGSGTLAGGQQDRPSARPNRRGPRRTGGSGASDRLLHERPVDPERGA
jgi:transcriptional regulator with XRE-family HTH domain